MPRLDVEQDVYDHLLRNAERIGEDASSILRRLLGLDGKSAEEQAGDMAGDPDLASFLRSPEMLARRSVTDRYLGLLGWLGSRHAGNGFEEKALAIRGRQRVYFARSRDEIVASGKSTHPKSIPSLGLWAMTNADSSQKRDIARRLMETLGYDARDIESAMKTLRG